MKPKFKPDEYHTATPYLIIRDAAQAIEFYQRVFGATEMMRMPGPGGKIMHAEIQIGDSRIMLADESPQMNAISPQTLGGSASFLMLYVDDVDTMFGRAVAAGAKAERPVQNQFYGDRSGGLVDPFGHRWHLATHIEDVTPEEITRRMAAMKGQPC